MNLSTLTGSAKAVGLIAAGAIGATALTGIAFAASSNLGTSNGITPATDPATTAVGTTGPTPNATDTPTPATTDDRDGRRDRGEVLHGTMVIKVKNNTFVTRHRQNGTVTAVSGTSITVQSTDDYTETWAITDATKVRRERADATAADITVGDKVRVGGTFADGTSTARRIDVRSTTAPTPPATPALAGPPSDEGDTGRPEPTNESERRPDGRGGDDGPNGRGPLDLGPPGRVLHSQVVVRLSDGSVTTRELQNGTITATSDSSVTVRSEDGFDQTWTLNGDTRMARDFATATIGDLAAGDKVRVRGTNSGGISTAVVIKALSSSGEAAAKARGGSDDRPDRGPRRGRQDMRTDLNPGMDPGMESGVAPGLGAGMGGRQDGNEDQPDRGTTGA